MVLKSRAEEDALSSPTPSESAIVVLKSREEEDALVAQRTAELGGGFWARVKAGRECRAPTTVGCVYAQVSRRVE